MIGLANLLLAAPAVAVGEAVVSSLAFLVRLNHAVLLKLNQTALRVPRLRAAKYDNILSHYYLNVFPLLTLLFNPFYSDLKSKLKDNSVCHLLCFICLVCVCVHTPCACRSTLR